MKKTGDELWEEYRPVVFALLCILNLGGPALSRKFQLYSSPEGDLFGLILGFTFIYLFYISTDPHRIAEKKAKIAKAKAEEAAANQKVRLAESDTPIDVASQVALKKIDAEIELAIKEGNAQRVLKYTKLRAELDKELKGG